MHFKGERVHDIGCPTSRIRDPDFAPKPRSKDLETRGLEPSRLLLLRGEFPPDNRKSPDLLTWDSEFGGLLLRELAAHDQHFLPRVLTASQSTFGANLHALPFRFEGFASAYNYIQ